MAGEKQPIVIKKITIAGGGAHGGGWKVAFADFMTAMMCFFLVMWLLNQSDEVKKEVSDYFTGPSIIEQNFKSYGAELTLEKLFLDLVNEPLVAVQQFMMPADLTPNLMELGSKRVIMHHIADKLGMVAQNLKIDGNSVFFEIPDHYLFEPGTSEPSDRYVEIITKVNALTAGLADSDILIESLIYTQSVNPSTFAKASLVGEKRLDYIKVGVNAELEHDTVHVRGRVNVSRATSFPGEKDPEGKIRIKISQSEETSDGSKPREFKQIVDEKKPEMNIYDEFVDKLSEGQRTNRTE